MLAKTLTEAQNRGGLVVVSQGENATYLSSARLVPYAEMYQGRTAIIETPAERLQRAGEDEARRGRKADQ